MFNSLYWSVIGWISSPLMNNFEIFVAIIATICVLLFGIKKNKK